jgi:hypothetical protein
LSSGLHSVFSPLGVIWSSGTYTKSLINFFTAWRALLARRCAAPPSRWRNNALSIEHAAGAVGAVGELGAVCWMLDAGRARLSPGSSSSAPRGCVRANGLSRLLLAAARFFQPGDARCSLQRIPRWPLDKKKRERGCGALRTTVHCCDCHVTRLTACPESSREFLPSNLHLHHRSLSLASPLPQSAPGVPSQSYRTFSSSYHSLFLPLDYSHTLFLRPVLLKTRPRPHSTALGVPTVCCGKCSLELPPCSSVPQFDPR